MQVAQRLCGALPLPWEDELSGEVKSRLGVFRGPVVELLRREPSQRMSMREFHHACTALFATQMSIEA